jgi:hypothetical protein
MPRSHFLYAIMAITALASPSIGAAQSAPGSTHDADIEEVIVTAPRFNFAVTPNAISHVFVQSYATPSLLLGTLPRWRVGICPETRGLPPSLIAVVNRRLRGIAAEVGAPVGDKNCKVNLSITFTSEPQKLLDNIRSKSADALGYHGATIITHPVQAWYGTGITDIKGHTIPDQEAFIDWKPKQYGGPLIYTSPTPISEVEGLPGRTGLRGELLSVFVIVDTGKTGSYQIDSMADYIAMMALSQTAAFDSCQIVASISNLISPFCSGDLKPETITASDIAYLRGVYKMDAGATLQVQQNEIAGEMAKSLPAR